jgi:chemotaxis protein histidine kinase CheA
VDQIKSQLDTLTELSDEQVAELQSNIISQFDTVEGQDPTPETVDAMTSLADALDTVRGELSRREAQAAELAAKAAEATARVKGEDDVQTDGEAMTDNSEMAEAPVEEVPAEAPVEDTPAEAAPVEAAPAEATPAEAAPAEEVPAEGTPEEEAGETPATEDEEKKKKEASEYSSETETASIIEGDGSELSTETNPEVVADAAPSEPTHQETIAPEEQEGQAPVTAAAEESFNAPADRQPVIQVTEAPVAITAGADIPGYTAGSTINSMTEVASAMEKRIHSLRRVNGGDGEQHIVASITTQYPEERILSTDALQNQAKIDAVVGQDALVASGGHAAPFEVKYDIYNIGSTTERPVRDLLPKFQADRGGIRFVTPPSFASGAYDNAVGVWTAARDLAPYSNTKTSLTVSAAAEQTVSTDAVTLQLQFGNLMTRAYPELIARHNELALVQHAREAEVNLLSKITAASTAVTTTSTIGLGRDFLVQVRRAAVAYRSRHRIAPSTQLKAIVPQWLYDAMAADLTLALPGDGTISVSAAEIQGYLAASNVTLVGSPDLNYFGAQTTGAVNAFPSTFDWYLFAEGSFLFLDGGTLDLGIIRDSSLVGTNDYKMFVETFENVAFVGIESLKVTSTFVVKGTTTAAVAGAAV